MSEPFVICDTCFKKRAVIKHQRADLPPVAALKWLLKHCCNDSSEKCKVRYQSGFLTRPMGPEQQVDDE